MASATRSEVVALSVLASHVEAGGQVEMGYGRTAIEPTVLRMSVAEASALHRELGRVLEAGA